MLDEFAVNVLHYQSCYIKFFIKPVKLSSRDDLQKDKVQDV